MKRSAQYKKGYKKGFNNPGSFDQAKKNHAPAT